MILTKILSGLSLILALYSALSTTLYLTTRSELKRLESSLITVKTALKDCEDSKTKARDSEEVDEGVSTSNQEAINVILNDKDKLLVELNKLKSKKCSYGTQGVNNELKEVGVAGINDKLPPDLISLLSESDSKD